MHPVYDGYTQVFTARAVVTPCQEYTIKLAIADAGDEIFDSGVFLEAKSFGTGTVDVALNTISLNGVVTESCADAEIVFSLEQAPEEDYVVDVNIFGSATDGVDYPSLPTEFIIPAGSNELVVPFTAFEDNVVEGEEFIAFEVQRDPCTLDTFYLYIRDNELPPLDLGPDIQICEIEGATLMGELPITLPDPPTFTNNQDLLIDPPNTILTSEIDVAGVLPIELGPDVIQSVCINVDHNWLSDLDIYLESPGGLFMELVTDVGSNGDDFVETCFVPGATLDIDYINPHATSTPFGDQVEAESIIGVFGHKGPLISATKSMHGHLLGATGALEAIISVLTIGNNCIVPTINCDSLAFDIPLVRDQLREQTVNHVLSNSFGFGGTNASLVISKY